MNVKELMEFLEQFEDDVEIVLSKDAEGNSFSLISTASVGFYIAESGFSGDFVDEDTLEQDEFINTDGAMEAIALWPIN